MSTKVRIDDGRRNVVETSSLSLPPIPGVLFDVKPYFAVTICIAFTSLLIAAMFRSVASSTGVVSRNRFAARHIVFEDVLPGERRYRSSVRKVS